MEKETCVLDDSETPESTLSVNSSVNSISFSVGNLSLKNGDDVSVSRTKEKSPDTQDSNKAAPKSLYPGTIWAPDNSAGTHLGFYSDMNSLSNNYQESRANFRFDIPYQKLEGPGLIMYAATEQGSRDLQKVLAMGNPHLTSEILTRITDFKHQIPVICYLLLDHNGHYVCLKLIEFCNDKQLELILNRITEYPEMFVKICCNIYGSKLIKRLIKILRKSPLVDSLTVRLFMNFYQLMINRVGSFVVLYCLDTLDARHNETLYEAMISHCLYLASHVTGCVSVNNFIDKIQGPHRLHLLEKISYNAVFLSQDPSGNHVVQKVLGLENPMSSAIIGVALKGHYPTLSVQKWGSHVVEKCLKSQAMIYAVEDLLYCSSSKLLEIARDQFGNYVIQRALEATKKGNNLLHLRLVKRLEEILTYLRTGYGKNVYNLIIKLKNQLMKYNMLAY